MGIRAVLVKGWDGADDYVKSWHGEKIRNFIFYNKGKDWRQLLIVGELSHDKLESFARGYGLCPAERISTGEVLGGKIIEWGDTPSEFRQSILEVLGFEEA